MQALLRSHTWITAAALAAAAGSANAHMPPICRGDGDPGCGRVLLVPDGPPPSPPPAADPPPAEVGLESWTSGEGSMPWTAQPITGATFLVTRDFVAPGFAVSGGVRHFGRFDPNPFSRSAAVAFATLGLAALPRGSILGNELGVDLSSRLAWASADAMVIETALHPVLRVQVAGSRVSLPSVLGAILPAVGFVTLSAEDADPHADLRPRYQGLLVRWGFAVRWVIADGPVLVFAELEPTAALVVPTRGEGPHAMFGGALQIGFSPLQR